MELLEAITAVKGNTTVGLRAGAQTDAGDLNVLEYVARSVPTIGEAMMRLAKYMPIMNEALDVRVEMQGAHALLKIGVVDGSKMPAAANDFIVAASAAFARRNSSVFVPAVEIWLAHEEPPYADEYLRYLGAPVKFGAPENVLVMQASRIDVPMLRPNPALARAFEREADRILQQLAERDRWAARVRERLAEELRLGPPSMRRIAQRLGMASATLRRRLEDEGVTFSQIVGDTRRQIAEQHLAIPGASVTEVAFALGYADVRTFARAFRRWTGQAPSDYRATRVA
jgi:AraC-like DNA-binding protein